MRALAPALLATAVIAGAAGAAPATPPTIGGCPVFPASSVWNQPRRPAAGREGLGDADPLDRARLAGAPRLRLGALRRAEDRHPLRRRLGLVDAEGEADVRLRRRVRPRALPDSAERADRGRPEPRRRRPPRADRRPRHLHALRAVRAPPLRQRLGSGLGRDLEPALEQAAAAHAGPRPTRRASRSCPGLARYDEVAAGAIDHALRFTAPETRRAFIYPARHQASDSTEPVAAADGPARAAEGELRHQRLPAAGAGDPRPRSSATG